MHLVKNLVFCLALALLVMAVGCDSGPEMGEVTGIVTIDDEPTANLEVSFDPKVAGSGTTAIGYTDASGAYQLSYPGGKIGAPLGEYSVSIVAAEMDEEEEAGPPISIPACYNSETTLSHTVTAGVNTANFNLKSAGE